MSLLSRVYRAVLPVREPGMTYTEHAQLPLSFRLVDLKFFPSAAHLTELEGWLSKVGRTYGFDPAEVFVVRDRLTFERDHKDKILRAFAPGELKRRAQRVLS